MENYTDKKLRIIGIDPGSRITGWSIIESDGKRQTYIASGIIRLTAFKEIEKLGELFKSIIELIETYKPQHLALERSFLGKNVNSTIKLAEARAMAMVAANINKIEVFEYAPREVKLMVAGNGNAVKEAVQINVKKHFNLEAKLTSDASDALAIALTHAIKLHNPLFVLSGKNKSNLTKRHSSWRKFIPKENNKTLD